MGNKFVSPEELYDDDILKVLKNLKAGGKGDVDKEEVDEVSDHVTEIPAILS